MADKATQPKEVESTVEEVDAKATKTVEEVTPAVVEDESKSENGDSPAENGDADKEKDKETEKNGGSEETTDKCCIKRKSTSGDATEVAAADGATPEKKAKLDETVEAESNGDAAAATEVAA